jgi:hypothetical protein
MLEKKFTLRMPVMICLLAFGSFSFTGMNECVYGSGDRATGIIKEDSKGEADSVEKYEREKFAKLRRQIGRRFMAVGIDHPLEFYESPENLEKKTLLKRKEAVHIVDVVRNPAGTMYFYKVKFESGKFGYLSADGVDFEIRIREGKFIPLSPKRPKKTSVSQRTKSLHTVSMASEAVEMVKNHLSGKDPITGDRKTVERRMAEAKTTSLPNLKWRYEAKEIGDYKYRVTQYVEGGPGPRTVRIWIVDLHGVKVTPENAAAKKLY